MKTSNTESSPSPFNNEDGTFFKVVKLKTGEFILCSMAKNISSAVTEMALTMIHPVQAVLSKQMTKDENVVAEMFTMRPWVGISGSSELTIPTDIVLTIGDMRKPVQKQYVEYYTELRKAEKIIEAEESADEMERSIYKLLTEVNKGGKVLIVRDENPRNI